MKQFKSNGSQGSGAQKPSKASTKLVTSVAATAAVLAAVGLLSPENNNAHPILSVVSTAEANGIVGQAGMQQPLTSSYGSNSGPAVADATGRKGIRILNDANCEQLLFPNSAPGTLHTNRPYFIMLYSPSCLHCQELMPHFDAVGYDVLYNQGPKYRLPKDRNMTAAAAAAIGDLSNNKNPFAPQFAAINMVENHRLRSLFEAKVLPSFLYTIGGHAYPYQGAQSADGFVRMAAVLTEAHRNNNPQWFLPSSSSIATSTSTSTSTPLTTASSNISTSTIPPSPPLSVPATDITSFNDFSSFWDTVTKKDESLNPMGCAATSELNLGVTPPLFVVCQPPSANDDQYHVSYSPDDAVRRPAFSTFVESLLSYGRARFATISTETPAQQAARAAVAATSSGISNNGGASAADAAARSKILSAYHQTPSSIHSMFLDTCASAFADNAPRRPSTGPNGEVLFLYSPDRSMKPIFYHGYSDGVNSGYATRKKWAGEGVADVSYTTTKVNVTKPTGATTTTKNTNATETTTEEIQLKTMTVTNPNVNDEQSILTRIEPLTSLLTAPTFRTSKAAALWVWENSFNLVEFGTSDVISSLPRRVMLGVLVLDFPLGPVNESGVLPLTADSTTTSDSTASDKKTAKNKKNAKKKKAAPVISRFAAHNITSYYPGLNWLSRKRYLAFRNKNKKTVESSVALDALIAAKRWPLRPYNTKLISLEQTDFDGVSWFVRWQQLAPMQIIVVSSETHKEWLEHIGATGPAFSGDEEGSSSSTTTTTPKGPYFFAYDTMGNRKATMASWLVDDKKSVLRGTRTSSEIFYQQQQREREEREEEGTSAASSSLPQGVSSVKLLPPDFEPKTGLALHLIDQFMTEFYIESTGGNHNGGGSATTTNYNTEGGAADGTTGDVSAALAEGEALRAAIQNAVVVEEERRQESARLLKERLNAAAVVACGGDNNANPNPISSTTAAAAPADGISDDEERDLQAAPIAGQVNGGDTTQPRRRRLQIEHTSHSAAIVKAISDVLPVVDTLLRLSGDDPFVFLLMILVSVVVAASVAAAAFGDRSGKNKDDEQDDASDNATNSKKTGGRSAKPTASAKGGDSKKSSKKTSSYAAAEDGEEGSPCGVSPSP